MMEYLFRKIDVDSISIRSNIKRNKLIKMDLFLSFLTVEVARSSKNPGSNTGWTLLTGDNGLKIGGGLYDGCEYLDSLQYKKNIRSPYNNYVNPFHLFDILNEDGKRFFINYYKDEIDKIINNCDFEIKKASSIKDELLLFLNNNK